VHFVHWITCHLVISIQNCGIYWESSFACYTRPELCKMELTRTGAGKTTFIWFISLNTLTDRTVTAEHSVHRIFLKIRYCDRICNKMNVNWWTSRKIPTWEVYELLTSLPKVIWEERRVAALPHTYAVKSPLVTITRPKLATKSTPSGKPIPKPHYLLHPWTRPTYDAKQYPDQIRRFSTMHCTYRRTDARTDRRTDREIVHGKVWPLRYESDAA